MAELKVFGGEKPCTVCRVSKRYDEFPVDGTHADGRGSSCKPCKAERKQRWRLDNPDQHSHNRFLYRLRGYGITEDEYYAMIVAQGGVCAICQGDHRGPGPRLHIDHDHATGIVRGLLCTPCNNGLGAFREDPRIFQRAAEYVMNPLHGSVASV